MSKLPNSFDKLLENIEPSSKAKKFAQEAHEPLREYLQNESDMKDIVADSFLYGSYKRNTAINTIKDVDIVICVDVNTNEEYKEPIKILRKLKNSLQKYYGTAEYLEYQRRSIRVDRPLDNSDAKLTLDVIPAVRILGQGTCLLVPDREDKNWMLSNPEGHISFTSRLNSEEQTKGTFVPFVKILKWWWKYQYTKSKVDNHKIKPKGFWLEVLAGQNLSNTYDCYADYFVGILENIVSKFGDSTQVPTLPDPGVQGQTVDTSMTSEEFAFFIETMKESLEIAKDAYNETDDFESSLKWRKVFGPNFPLSERQNNSVAAVKITAKPQGPWCDD